ncbi:hypothetical protein F5Y03DRAFT_407909 [Xylaria venustula]|nr:hypothetical protein F5Y03DRAFT_407909 [Xylaria venustula]
MSAQPRDRRRSMSPPGLRPLWKPDQYRRRDDRLSRATAFRTHTNKIVIDNNSDSSDEAGPAFPRGRVRADNPALRPGLNATTIGFELEFAVAASMADHGVQDPHGIDRRWLSDILTAANKDLLPFKFTVKNKLIDTLVAASIPIRKDDIAWYVGRDEEERGFEWWDSLEYNTVTEGNLKLQLYWDGFYEWDVSYTEDENIAFAVEDLVTQFWDYHAGHYLEPHTARRATLQSIRNRLQRFITGPVPRNQCIQMIEQRWYDIVWQQVKDARESRYAPGNMDIEDPNSRASVEIDRRYRRWSVLEDPSVCAEWPDAASYRMQPPARRTMQRLGYQAPSDAYHWFGAELVSPVLDYNSPRTLTALRRATKALRDNIRIHKPLSAIHSGVHIHIGQEAGWTLLHLKKFATLWSVLEPHLYKLHRRDRQSSQYCIPMNPGCNLANLVYRRNRNFREYGATTRGAQEEAYRNQMNRFVPEFNRRRRLAEFLGHVWQYRTIDELGAAMGSPIDVETCVRWRITGFNNRSPRPVGDRLQTLEFRMMQGTLDANHIWKWAGILERLVVFARDSTEDEFRAAMTDIAAHGISNLLGLNQEDLQWFQARRNDQDHFQYPDRDRVDWRTPFMTTGHGETHT